MPCRFCRSAIEPGAKVCSTCRLYQSLWLNFLPYLGGLVAVIAVATSAFVYGLGKWQEVQANKYGSVGLRVLSANSSEEATILNTGGRNVFVCYAIFETQCLKRSRSINRMVKAGELAHFEYKQTEPRALFRCLVGELARSVRKGGVFENQDYWFMTNDHPELSAHIDLEEDHAILEGKMTVVYYPSGEFEARKEDVSCKVLVIQHPDKAGRYSDKPIGVSPGVAPTPRAASPKSPASVQGHGPA